VEYRTFGDTDLEVSVVGFGGWPMGGSQYGETDDAEGVRAVHGALDMGISCFDNAAGYGLGHSERVMGGALQGHRKEVVIVTKCGLAWNEEAQRVERKGTREHVLESTEASLRNLDTDYIDLMLIHGPDRWTPFAETMGALEELQKAGKIRYAGVSNFLPEMMDECRRHLKLVTNQMGYSLLDRRIERDILGYCGENAMGIMTYGSLAHGLLAGNMTAATDFEETDWRASGNAFGLPLFRKGGHFEENVAAADRLQTIARREGHTLPDLALAWVLNRSTVTTALVGFRTPAEVEDAARASEWKLSAELLEEIESISSAAYERLAADEEMSPARGAWNPWNREAPRFAGGAPTEDEE
jgi:aryl-alcohol dehydrogenase-like predicted oxidoreductase